MSRYTAERSAPVGVSKESFILNSIWGEKRRIGITYDLFQCWVLQAARGEGTVSTALLSCLQLLTIAGAILFSLKVDGYLSASWVTTWAPLWVVNAAGLLFFAAPVGRAAVRASDEPGRVSCASLLPCYRRLLELAKLTLLLLFQVLLALRLDGRIGWSWTDVMLPLLAWSVLWVAADLYILRKILPGLARKKYLYTLLHFAQLSLQVLQVVLLMLKIEGKVTDSWGVIFLPTWLSPAVSAFNCSCWPPIVFALLSGRREVTVSEMEQTRRSKGITSMTLNFVPGAEVFALLAVLRIVGSIGSTFVVLIPLFVVLGFGLCCAPRACIPAANASDALSGALRASLTRLQSAHLSDHLGAFEFDEAWSPDGASSA